MEASREQINQQPSAAQIPSMPITLVGVNGVNQLNLPEARLARAISSTPQGQAPELINQNSSLPTFTGSVALECLQELGNADLDIRRAANIAAAVQPLIGSKAAKTVVKSLINTIKIETPADRLQKDLASSGFEKAKAAQNRPRVISFVPDTGSLVESITDREVDAPKPAKRESARVKVNRLVGPKKQEALVVILRDKILKKPKDFFDEDFYAIAGAGGEDLSDELIDAFKEAEVALLNDFEQQDYLAVGKLTGDWASDLVSRKTNNRLYHRSVYLLQTRLLNRLALVASPSISESASNASLLLGGSFEMATRSTKTDGKGVDNARLLLDQAQAWLEAIDVLPDGVSDEVKKRHNAITAHLRSTKASSLPEKLFGGTGVSSITRVQLQIDSARELVGLHNGKPN